MENIEIVKSTDPRFRDCVARYFDLIAKSIETFQAGGDDPPNKVGHMGLMWGEVVKELPRPMSCPDLELVPVQGDSASWAFFCHKMGCLCVPMRADLEGEYPDACPEHDLEALRYLNGLNDDDFGYDDYFDGSF